MAAADKEPIIVAIELGTSRISGIAGKKKNGTMQILAYAEEQTTACIKRGIVYNIDKTTQAIRDIVGKLKATLKLNVAQVYVGLGGQSVRSVRSKVHRNMLTQTYITAEHIDAMKDESCKVPAADCDLLANFPQQYTIDGSPVDAPVGVMGVNVEGEYLNVIARRLLEANIRTCFSNTTVRVADTRLSAFELAENVLTEQEKRAGSALIDLGAGTTTVVVYKNNIVRHLVTLPIGFANIAQDLTTLQIDEKEATQVMHRYGNAYLRGTDPAEIEEMAQQTYTTSFDKKIDITDIQKIIDARLAEIIDNVNNQIFRSTYSSQLLGGIVLTGGGSKMKNIERAFAAKLNIEKVRIARTLTQPVIKNSAVTNLSIDDSSSVSIIALLMAGEESCTGEAFSGAENIFEAADKEAAAQQKREAEAAAQRAESEAIQKLEDYKGKMREGILHLDNATADVHQHDSDRRKRKQAEQLLSDATALLGPGYDSSRAALADKDKNKQTLREAEELAEKYQAALNRLDNEIQEARRKNSFLSRTRKYLDDLVNEK